MTLVDVIVNNAARGKVEISVQKLSSSAIPMKSYPSVVEARQALLAFGIDTSLVDRKLEQLAEMEPRDMVTFPSVKVPGDVLWGCGFKDTWD